MKQENQVTPSTTNTAARELLASALDECGRPTDAAEVRVGRNPFVRGEYALSAIESALAITLETPDGLPLLPVAAAWMHVDAPEYESPVYTADQMRAYATAALRTKQPAASEGDGIRVERAEYFSPTEGGHFLRVVYRWPHNGKLLRHTQFVELRSKDQVEHLIALLNTSKQAAGEAVAWTTVEQLERVSLGEIGFIARQDMVEPAPNVPLYTTPPRHPADEMARDAARYRWLREADNDEIVLRYPDGRPVPVMQPDESAPCYLLRLEKLDAAIDAALQPGSPK